MKCLLSAWTLDNQIEIIAVMPVEGEPHVLRLKIKFLHDFVLNLNGFLPFLDFQHESFAHIDAQISSHFVFNFTHVLGYIRDNRFKFTLDFLVACCGYLFFLFLFSCAFKGR